MFNQRDLANTNPLNPQSQNRHHSKIVGNPFLTNSSIGPTRFRHDNLGLNNSVKNNTYINDITHVIVDSRNRNREEYPIPNDYKIEMGKLFSNIKVIRLVDINISNTIPPLNLRNNSLIWEYPTTDEISNINNILLPSNSLSSDKIFLGTNLLESFHNVQSLEEQLENELTNVLHKTEFNDVEEYSNHRFTIRINPITQLVQIVNRIETLPIYAIQTILNSSDDVLAGFRVGAVPSPDSCDNAFIVTFKKELTSNEYPLVITDSPSIADISEETINFITYFEESLGSEEQYELFDELNIDGVSYFRYKFMPEVLNVQESENIIFTMSGGNLVNSLNTAGEVNYVANSNDTPEIGRALPFRFFFQRSQFINDPCLCQLNPLNEDGNLRTVLELLGWNVRNNDIDSNNTVQYQYVHTNKGSYLENDTSFSSTVNGQEFSFPNNLLDLEIRDGIYYFRSMDYIFLRLLINDDQAEWGNQLLVAGPIETPENQSTNIFYNVNLNKQVTDAQKIQTKNLNNLFAKIDLDTVPSNVTNVVNDVITYDIDFKNEQLDELQQIRVQFLDREGRILNLRGEHNFVLEVVTKRNVLENILFNSKNG